jgi:lactoylglutathione lyase
MSAFVQVQQIDHLNMTVRNLKESVVFYKNLFGFEVVEEGGSEDTYPWAILRSKSAMLCLYEHEHVETSRRFPHPPVVQEVRHFAFRVLDGPGFESLCRESGIELIFGGPVRWPRSTSYYIADPTGHQIEVVAWDDDEIRFA